jgi:hypothetical protein
VSEPETPTLAEIFARVEDDRAVLALLRASRKRPDRLSPAVAEAIVDFFFRTTAETNASLHEVRDYVQPQMAQAEAQVTKPTTLLEQYVRLPCGQQLAVLVVFLLVLLSFDLPSDVQEKLWGLITELGAAIWVIQKITKR